MNEHLAAFVGYLTDKEKSKSTIESYTRYVKKFLKYVDGNERTKELVIQYRELLEREGSAVFHDNDTYFHQLLFFDIRI